MPEKLGIASPDKPEIKQEVNAKCKMQISGRVNVSYTQFLYVLDPRFEFCNLTFTF